MFRRRSPATPPATATSEAPVAVRAADLAAAGWATLASGVLPRWTGWLALVGAVLCALCVPAMYGGPIDYAGIYNAGGWGPVVVANFPPLLWFLVVGIIFIRGHTAPVTRHAAA